MNPQNDRIRGLDSIRFVCALWVVFSHFGGPALPSWIDKGTPIGWMIHGIYANLFSGPAAVIVFFVVSGFCIHYPHRNGLQVPSLAGFYTRRYVRIVIPMIAAIWLSNLLGRSFKLFENSILWSLFAELVYYSIYPLLLAWRRKCSSWRPLVAVTFILALLLVALFPDGMRSPTPGDYPVYGIQFNWLLGLPCWLIGCAVAEAAKTPGHEGRYGVWILRLAILAAASICSVLRFHTPIGYPWSLNFFALFVGYWLTQEVRRPSKPTRIGGWLEWAGSWSYSLYLTHGIARTAFVLILGPDAAVNSNAMWFAQIMFILAFAVVFAYAFEFSAHRLARWLGQTLSSLRRAS